MNKLSLVGMQLPEKYKENFDVILLITYVFRVVASLPTKQFQDIFNITDVFMYFNLTLHNTSQDMLKYTNEYNLSRRQVHFECT
jgi:hypothetical protein